MRIFKFDFADFSERFLKTGMATRYGHLLSYLFAYHCKIWLNRLSNAMLQVAKYAAQCNRSFATCRNHCLQNKCVEDSTYSSSWSGLNIITYPAFLYLYRSYYSIYFSI